uniref:LRRCT domain-containing protein n=1 Tax=Anopheles culicifacies TaxID=139723 RepID=A0A182M164_9DIPT
MYPNVKRTRERPEWDSNLSPARSKTGAAFSSATEPPQIQRLGGDAGLEYMFKFGYTIVLVTVAIMIWASLARAREIDSYSHPPCAFNPLCSCSKSAPDLGIVNCRKVLFPAVPKVINSSKLFMLTMDSTGLRELEPYFLQSTGLYRLEITNNPLTELPDEALYGLERSLWELVLEHNQLVDIPSRTIRDLRKLRLLSLRGNDITTVASDAFRGVESTLQTLILADNSITQLAPNTLAGLPNLESLDLTGNGLIHLDASVFRDGLGKLTKLLLADNLLQHVPYDAVSVLIRLRTLDLSRNHLQDLSLYDDEQQGPGMPGGNFRLTLDSLNLSYNGIETLPAASFTQIDTANVTILDGNPLSMIEDNAFRSAKIRELYVRHCDLDHVQPEAFSGLENFLQVLDLSGNNLTEVADNLFRGFDNLRYLNVKDNLLRLPDQRNASPFARLNLHRLEAVGQRNQPLTLADLGSMRNLRTLTISNLPSTSLGPDDFVNFSPELEELRLNRAAVKVIKAHAFTHVRGLKRLDLSENRIDSIEPDAFTDVGHSLVTLRASHGLGSQLVVFPIEAFRKLTALEALDLSNNRLKAVGDTSFHMLRNLVSLELHDNQIDMLAKGTFQADIHTKLMMISLSYNNIKQLFTHTFVDLEELEALLLEDNRIETIEKRAFMNLSNLKLINLRGNRLSKIADEAFQNLPELEKLDLAYNSLSSFDFMFLDQVGSLTSLEVDVSYNKIKTLGMVDNVTDMSGHGNREQQQQQQQQQHQTIIHSNIRSLDFTSNNISRIIPGYFRPTELSLMKLVLRENKLTMITRELFGNMPHLHWLDLSDNEITDLEYDTLRTTRKLQVLLLSHNLLTEVPAELFRTVNNLRVLELAHNSLKYLPDNLLLSEGLERLDVSHNQFTKIPVTALSNMAALSLCELDLSHNHIGAIHSIDLSNKFRSLSWLDLSHNRLVRLEDAAFATLPRLSVLNLSHNDELEVMGKAFVGLENSLIELLLSNVSLSSVPELSNPSLRTLKISHNDLPSIPPELAANMTSLRNLDLSENDLTSVPLITHSLPNLRHLSLSGNPITALSNTSLLGAADTLEHLDIANLNLHSIETGVLNKLHYLRSLRISTFPALPNFNIPRILENANNLRELWIEAAKAPSGSSATSANSGNTSKSSKPIALAATDLRREMDGLLPHKLQSITFGGTGFSRLSDNILKGARSATLHFRLHNTSLVALPGNLFRHMGKPVRNVTVTIDDDNDLLQTVPNPNTAHYLALPEHVFLTELQISGSVLNCDCEIGWIEFWQRKRRQYLCPANPWTETSLTNYFKHTTPLAFSKGSDCGDSANELRQVRCSNKNNDLLLEVLKKDLECGWGSTGNREFYDYLEQLYSEQTIGGNGSTIVGSYLDDGCDYSSELDIELEEL